MAQMKLEIRLSKNLRSSARRPKMQVPQGCGALFGSSELRSRRTRGAAPVGSVTRSALFVAPEYAADHEREVVRLVRLAHRREC